MNIPIFPLRTVLFPYARMPLQIFEPRYMDMVKMCLKQNSEFGIVRICHGSEVINAGVEESLDIEYVGTMARIVDFDALPNNRLKIIIEGTRKFTITDTVVAKDQLITADVELSSVETSGDLGEGYMVLADVLRDLVAHSSVKPLNFELDLRNGVKVANQLACLLPIDIELKQELLEQDTYGQQLELLSDIVEQLSD